jgi:hypothetical protein
MGRVQYAKDYKDIASSPYFSISDFEKVVSGNKISLVGSVVGGTHTGVPCYSLSNTLSMIPRPSSTL